MDSQDHEQDGSVRAAGATLAMTWRVRGREARVAVEGELDTETAGELSALIDRLVDAGATRLVLDVSALEFLDSSGLRALIRARARLVDVAAGRSDPPDDRAPVELVGAPPFVRRLLVVTGLDDLFALP